MNLQIYRNDIPHILIPIDENTFFSQVVMGEHIISSSFIVPAPIDIDEGDYVMFRGERFTVNRPLPQVEKTIHATYKYDLIFEGYIYDLHDKVFRHLGSMEFSLFATASTFLQILVDNLNETSSGWVLGKVDVTEEMLIDFTQEGKGYTCKGALIKIAETFKLEFWLNGKTVNLTKQAGVETNLDFEYGRGNGLHTVTRGEINNQQFFNRIYGQGGSTNIPYGYRNGAKRLTLPEGYLEVPIPTGKRRREASVILDDIYPKRTGTLTGVSADWLTITDASIDFDLNGLKIDGETPKVSFTSGENSGREFEIDSYNHTTKTITLKPLVEADGYTYPNATFAIATGDKYVLLGIEMPAEIVTTAESDLRAKMQELLNESVNSTPPYSVEIDEKYMRDNGITVNAGDRARLKDSSLNIDRMIRINSVKFPLVNVNAVDVVLSDVVIYSDEAKQIIDTEKIKKDVTIVNKTNAERARLNVMNLRRLQNLTFDPDGYFDTERIKPLSIETGMLSVGAKSQNFSLNGVTINTSTGGNPNLLTISQGALIHYEVSIPEHGYVWQIASGEFPALDPAKSYFLSAKCSRNELTGIWYLSETPMIAESEAGFYHFNLGVLYPVGEDGVRGFDFTNGMTFITGDRITTGRIQSLDGLNWFDLTGNSFKLGDVLSGIDWNVSTPGKLTISGDIIATNANFINLFIQNLATGIENTKRVVISASDNNIELIGDDNKPIVVIDDDVANQGDGTYGSGMRIGRVGETPASTASAKGFYIYGADGTELSFIRGDANVNSVGIFTKSALQVDGLSNLNNLSFRGNLSPGIGLQGVTGEWDVRTGGEQFYKMKWVKGVLVSSVKI